MTAPAPRFWYGAFGLTIASDVALPQLCVVEADGKADLRIELGAVAAEPVSAPRLRRRAIARLFRYECIDGALARIQLEPEADPAGAADMIIGRLLTVIAYQRDILPLHAGAVEAGMGLVAFAGPSGAGKSTLTAAMTARGLPLAADDLLATKAGDRPLAAGGTHRMKLSAASLAGLGWPAGTELSNATEGKYLVAPPVVGTAGADWRPLRAVFNLIRGEPGLRRLSPLEAAAVASRVVKMPELIDQCGQAASHWQRWIALAGRAPIVDLSAPDDLEAMPYVADLAAAFIETELI
jgi:hypothetical protein